ncbi:MAG: ParB/Sulfiredoxin domain [Thermoplasmata archaeon]|jgi:hypothetical protein|nr:ParB/Sulfiredoxin domain [Thermoplasmata archaeon]
MDQTERAVLNWLKAHRSSTPSPGTAHLPGDKVGMRPFVLASVPLAKLDFQDHRFNPRTPSPAKVNELSASIRYLGLLTPLTCCYIEEEDKVVLIDGRHRYGALKSLAQEDAAWAKEAEVDVKIYYRLLVSDIYILATYLNRTRRNLKKGEYYQVIVNIYENKQQELESETRKKHTEKEIFGKISHRELTDRNFDLSIGRLVGIAAFDEEEDDAWFPYVGNHQSARVQNDSSRGYCPLTAGNLASFLRFLCKAQPYDDVGQARAIELANVIELGRIFHKGLLEPVESYMQATATTVACKHWPLVAFGHLLRDSSIFADREAKSAPFATTLKASQKTMLTKAVAAYKQVMAEQATLIQEFKESDNDQDILRKAWSYQTQKNLILGYLKDELEARVTGFTAKIAEDDQE